MLYTEPILRLLKSHTKFAYADDFALLRTGPSLTVCTKKLSEDVALLMKWGEQNAISFDLNKTELQHFTVAPKPKEYPNIRVKDSEIPANQATFWLGVWLDRKLSFLEHTTKWSAKAFSVSNFLRRLNNTQRGSSPQLVQKAVKTCVLPIALFGAEVWWPGPKIYAWRRCKLFEKDSQNGKQIALINRAIISGIRAILPVLRPPRFPHYIVNQGFPQPFSY